MTARFECTFRRFVEGLPYAEVYDDDCTEESGKRADYLLFERRAVGELKCLENDPANDIQAFAAGLMRERGIALYGQISLQRLFSSQSDHDVLNRRAIRIASGCLDPHVKDANRQIRATRERLGPIHWD